MVIGYIGVQWKGGWGGGGGVTFQFIALLSYTCIMLLLGILLLTRQSSRANSSTLRVWVPNFQLSTCRNFAYSNVIRV